MANQYPPAKCPRCGRLLDASGEVSIDGEAAQPVYERSGVPGRRRAMLLRSERKG